MTDDYEQSEAENNQLYDDYSGLLISKNELQAQLDNLISEINTISCPPIEYSNSDMKSEQLFCTFEIIDPIKFDFDDDIYTLSFIQDSIPQGVSIIKTPGNVFVYGTPYSVEKDLFSFDLKFTSDTCEEVRTITLARSPNSPTITYISGSLSQSIAAGTQIDPVEYKYGGSAEGLTFSNLPDGLTYTNDGNKYTIQGVVNEAGSYSFQVSTVNQSGCLELYETVTIQVEEAAIPTSTGGSGSGGSSGGGSGGGSGGSSGGSGGSGGATQYQLTVNTGANGSVSTTGGTYSDGTSISVTANPDTGYGFVNWTDSSGNELSTNTTYSFNLSSNTTITANYEELIFYLHSNGVTILCPNAIVGATGTINGVQYTKVDRNSLIAKRNAGENLALVCTSGITDLNSMFRKQYTTSNPAVSSDISSWDTSKNTSMSRMFANTDFNQDISNWDTGEVVNMYNAFQNAWEFNQDISGWDTRKVVTMRQTFRLAKRFNQDISEWKIPAVNDMRGFLKQTEDFDQDLSDWDVTGVTQCDQFILNAQSMSEAKIPTFTNCTP
jgi:surface protein